MNGKIPYKMYGGQREKLIEHRTKCTVVKKIYKIGGD